MNIDELRDLYRELHEEAVELARCTFDGALGIETSNPCQYLVRDAYHGAATVPPAWPRSWKANWHLPEPFSGEMVGTQPAVAFVGCNPSIDWREACPTVDTGLDEWLSWWRRALDEHGHYHPAVEPVPLYEEYQRVLQSALGPGAMLGRDAVVLDAIHYKCVSPTGAIQAGAGAKLRAALDHPTSAPLTVRVLRALRVRVIVTVGNEATRSVGAAFAPALAQSRIREVHGSTFQGGGAVIVPARHRNDFHYPWTMREPVVRAIRAAVRGPAGPKAPTVRRRPSQ